KDQAFLLLVPHDNRLAAINAVVDRVQDANSLAVQRAFPARHVHLRLLWCRVLEMPLPSPAQKRAEWIQMFVQPRLLGSQAGHGQTENQQQDSCKSFHKNCVSITRVQKILEEDSAIQRQAPRMAPITTNDTIW